MERNDQTLGEIIRELRTEASTYIETRLELARLSTYEKTSNVTASIVVLLLIASLFLLIFLFISIALGMYLGKVFNDNWLGFISVAGIYALLLIMILFFRKTIMGKIQTSTLDQLMKSDEEKNNDAI